MTGQQLAILVPQMHPVAPAIAEKLTALGFMYVSLDLQGYRAGSMNDEIVAEGDGLA